MRVIIIFQAFVGDDVQYRNITAILILSSLKKLSFDLSFFWFLKQKNIRQKIKKISAYSSLL